MTTHLELSCDHAILAMWDVLRNEADETLTERVRAHLEICRRCRERFAYERDFLASVSRIVDTQTDIASLRHRIVRALSEHGFHSDPAE